jgi:hypothetical protein
MLMSETTEGTSAVLAPGVVARAGGAALREEAHPTASSNAVATTATTQRALVTTPF